MTENANELGPHHEPYGVVTQPQNTGMVLAMKECDGGFLLEANAPLEKFTRRAVIAGVGTSKNTQKAVVRKFRRMIAEWAECRFNPEIEVTRD